MENRRTFNGMGQGWGIHCDGFDCCCHLASGIDRAQKVDLSLKCNIRSANGADWRSQGQVLSSAKHVAPGTVAKVGESTESA